MFLRRRRQLTCGEADGGIADEAVRLDFRVDVHWLTGGDAAEANFIGSLDWRAASRSVADPTGPKLWNARLKTTMKDEKLALEQSGGLTEGNGWELEGRGAD